MTGLKYLAALLATCLISTTAHAATLVLEADVVLELEGGSDDEGLDGATLSLQMLFEDGTAFSETAFGEVTLQSSSHSVSISGASDPARNGDYAAAAPLSIVYTLGIILAEVGADRPVALPGLADRFQIFFDFTAVTFPTIGAPLELSDLANLGTSIPDGVLRGFAGSSYEIDDGSRLRVIQAPAAVPLPASGLALMAGIGCLTLSRRRQG